MRPTSVWGFAALLALAGCGPSSDSLVGATNLQSAVEVARETIQINRDSAVGRQDHYLTYELKPDNTLTVTHALDGYQGDQVVGSESFQLATERASKIRSVLTRFRPAKLQGVEYLVYPVGCDPPIDGGAEVAIAFFGGGDKIGIFALPYDCKKGYSARARATFRELMKSLPSSKVAEAFPESA